MGEGVFGPLRYNCVFVKRKKISWFLVLFQLEPDLRRTHGQTINGVIFSDQRKNFQGRFLA